MTSLQRDPIVVGLALDDDRDAASLKLGGELGAFTAAPLVLLHAHPFEPLIAVPPPKWERERRTQLHAQLEDAAAPLRSRLDVSVDVSVDPSPVRVVLMTT